MAAKEIVGYGGAETAGKVGLPVVKSLPLHVVLRAQNATSTYNLLHRKNRFKVDARVYTLAKRYEVKVHEYSNQGHQLHLLISAPTRHLMTCYLRLITGQIAQMVTGAKKGVKTGKYWASMCWSRLLKDRKELSKVKTFIRHGKIPVFWLKN